MTAATTLPTPVLVTIPDVVIGEVGDRWPASTGPWTVTPEDLVSAVEAIANPAIHAPRNKVGHTSPWFGAEPSIGTYQNLRLTHSGLTLVADLVGVPRWMAEAIPHCWPSRSVEACSYTPSQGTRTYRCVITAVALLGVRLPGIDRLEDFAPVLSATTMAEAGVTLLDVPTIAASAGSPRTIAAEVTDWDVRDAYYDSLSPGQDYNWVRMMYLAPHQVLIVEDNGGDLWQVPFTIDDDETVSFGAPVQVQETFTPVTEVAAEQAEAPRRGIIYADRAESRPVTRGVGMDPSALRELVGLPTTATDDEVTARLADLNARPDPEAAPPPPEAPEPTPVVPDGAVLIDAELLTRLQADAARGVHAAERQAADDEEAFIGRLRSAGRLAPRTNPAGERLELTMRHTWRRDRTEAEATGAVLAQVVPLAAAGHTVPGDEDGETDWTAAEMRAFPELSGGK